jgi:hypothetical protein
MGADAIFLREQGSHRCSAVINGADAPRVESKIVMML